MATPRELVEAVAKETGVPLNTVVQHDRNLSLAGFRTVGGRGRAAARVTYEDAANLLIAVAASRNVKDSAETVKVYGELRASAPLVTGGGDAEVRWGVTFREALADLLQSVPLNCEKFAGPAGDSISVSLFGPEPRAKINFYLDGSERPLTAKYDDRSDTKTDIKFSDLVFISRFSQITLGLVGETIGQP